MVLLEATPGVKGGTRPSLGHSQTDWGHKGKQLPRRKEKSKSKSERGQLLSCLGKVGGTEIRLDLRE